MILAPLLAAVSPLVGAWQVEHLDAVVVADGRVVPNEAVNDADHATGIIVYDASGWMTLQIGAGNRAPDRLGAAGRRRDIATGSYYAYYGRYAIDPGRHVVRHQIADSLMPPEIGMTALRHYTIEGDRLTLTSDPVQRQGGQRINRITFRRLAGPSPTLVTTGQH